MLRLSPAPLASAPSDTATQRRLTLRHRGVGAAVCAAPGVGCRRLCDAGVQPGLARPTAAGGGFATPFGGSVRSADE
eukprot:COSAG01_NODE_185_length_22691_cov_53.142478_4_plen_77_part_00